MWCAATLQCLRVELMQHNPHQPGVATVNSRYSNHLQVVRITQQLHNAATTLLGRSKSAVHAVIHFLQAAF